MKHRECAIHVLSVHFANNHTLCPTLKHRCDGFQMHFYLIWLFNRWDTCYVTLTWLTYWLTYRLTYWAILIYWLSLLIKALVDTVFMLAIVFLPSCLLKTCTAVQFQLKIPVQLFYSWTLQLSACCTREQTDTTPLQYLIRTSQLRCGMTIYNSFVFHDECLCSTRSRPPTHIMLVFFYLSSLNWW